MFFFAEDVVHVVHAYNAFIGNYHTFWSNFFGSWMQDHLYTSFYRPLPELTFGIDYLLFGLNAYGYHLTNLIWHTLATMMFFIAIKTLVMPHDKRNAHLIAAIAASIFATYPLHPEAIYWLVNRTDLIAMVAMLCSWIAFMKARRGVKGMTAVSLFCMVVALMSKESTISLPPLLVATHVYLEAKKCSRKEILRAFSDTSKHWILLGAYVVFRLIILNGPGGYIGSGAIVFAENFLHRITSIDDWLRCAYPINETVTNSHVGLLRTMLSTMYGTAGLLILLRLFKGIWSQANTRLVLFAAAAFWITLAPAAQLWCIMPNLVNSRLMYVPSAFIALGIAAVVLPVGLRSKKSKPFWIAGTAWSILLAVLFACTHLHNNQPWHIASKNLRGIYAALQSTVKHLPACDKVAILNLPLDERNPLSMCCPWHLIMPVVEPFLNKNMNDMVLATQSTWFEGEIKNISRIEDFMADDHNHAMVWDSSKLKLVDCAKGKFPRFGARLDGAKRITPEGTCSDNGQTVSFDLPLNTVDARLAGLIKVQVAPQESISEKNTGSCSVMWTSYDRPEISMWRCLSRNERGQPGTYYFPTAEQVRWRLAPQRISQLFVTPPKCHIVKSVELLDESSMVPAFRPIDDSKPSNVGVYILNQCMGMKLRCDASKIDEAASLVVEISKPNLRFHELSNTYRDTQLNKHFSKHIRIDSTSTDFELKREMFSQPGRYDVRLVALSAKDDVVGFTSDPLEVEVR